ncbi:hypothetical protein P3G55_10815 [Leptospira sp. 96542]|nr:hypothetical protein [Leptospira sp. 96542]
MTLEKILGLILFSTNEQFSFFLIPKIDINQYSKSGNSRDGKSMSYSLDECLKEYPLI